MVDVVYNVDYTFLVDIVPYLGTEGNSALRQSTSSSVYGIRRSLIGVGSITEVKQRRARFIIGCVTAWDCQVLYTLGHVASSDVVSWGSVNHVNQMTRLTELDLDIKEPRRPVSIRRDTRKSIMCEHLAHNFCLERKIA